MKEGRKKGCGSGRGDGQTLSEGVWGGAENFEGVLGNGGGQVLSEGYYPPPLIIILCGGRFLLFDTARDLHNISQIELAIAHAPRLSQAPKNLNMYYFEDF